jgi:hypothetical protein
MSKTEQIKDFQSEMLTFGYVSVCS